MAKMKIVKSFVADDGKEFDTREACEAYELRDMLKPLTRMTVETLEAIMAGQDEARANIMRKIVSAIPKGEGESQRGGTRQRRSKEEREADLLAKLAKLRNGSGESQGESHGLHAHPGHYQSEGEASFS